MDSLQQKDYAELIDALVDHRYDDLNAQLEARRELIDEGLLEALHLARVRFEREDPGQAEIISFLGALTAKLSDQLSWIVQPSSPVELQEDTPLEFILSAIQVFVDQGGDGAAVHPIFILHLRFFNEELPTALRGWIAQRFTEPDSVRQLQMAAELGNFADFLAQWPLGEQTATIATALAIYQSIHLVFAREGHSVDWARAHERAADMLCRLPFRDPLPAWRDAELHYQHALLVSTATADPEVWIRIQTKLAVLYQNSPVPDRLGNVLRFIACREKPLQVWTVRNDPQNWAAVRLDMGWAYDILCTEGHLQYLPDAIGCYESALRAVPRKRFPLEFRRAQERLGSIHLRFQLPDPEAAIRASIRAYETALELYPGDERSLQWAENHSDLGILYTRVPGGNRRAIRHNEAALSVFTAEDHPLAWARVHNNLGLACLHLSREEVDGRALLREATTHFRAALRVYTKRQTPNEWLLALTNLGQACGEAAVDGPNEPLRRAAGCFRATLLVSTEMGTPQDWAKSQLGLGSTLANIKDAADDRHFREAIACVRAALRVYKEETHPKEWAEAQGVLAYVHSRWRTGKPHCGKRQALRYLGAALRVYTEAGHPLRWAAIRLRAGSLHAELGERRSGYHTRAAVRCFQAALRVYKRATHPKQWADAQTGLANVYGLQPGGDQARRHRTAIRLHRAAARVYRKLGLEVDWAHVQSNLGATWAYDLQGSAAVRLRRARRAFDAALTVYTEQEHPEHRARVLANMAHAYVGPYASSITAKNALAAIACCEDALRVRTRQADAEGWAFTRTALGKVYIHSPAGDPRENLRTAIACLEEVQEVYTEKDFPEDWAQVQGLLGVAYGRMSGDGLDALERTALAHFEAATRVYTEKSHPQHWAGLQGNIASVYRTLHTTDLAANLVAAVHHCRSGLRVCSPARNPLGWAHLHDILAGANYRLAYLHGRDRMWEAVKHYKLALRACTRRRYPRNWATTQANLGNAYTQLVTGDLKEHARAAIKCFKAALQIHTRREDRESWARVHGNLGNAYHRLALENGGSHLRLAARHIELGLQVYRPEVAPQLWASLQSNLGNVYSALAARGVVGALDKALGHYRAALEVFTPEALPEDCLRTGRNLGRRMAALGRWDEAERAFDLAVQAAEQMRRATLDETDKENTLSSAIDAYHGIIQANLNLGRPATAMEYAGRSKSRTLVELMHDLGTRPKGDFSPEVLRGLDEAKRYLDSCRRQLAAQVRARSLGVLEPVADPAGERFYAAGTATARQQEAEAEFATARSALERYIRTHISETDPTFLPSSQVGSPCVEEIRALVTDDSTALIEWYFTEDRFHTFVVIRDKDEPVAHSSTEEEFREFAAWVDEYLHGYHSDHSRWLSSLEVALARLSRILRLGEICDSLPSRIDRLILVPHRHLHVLPLHGLPVESTSQGLERREYLLDRFSRGVSYAPNCQTLSQTLRHSRTEFRELFAVQNPTGDLRYADLEVEAIRQFFASPSQVLAGPAATRSAVMSEHLWQAHCIHFACHGRFHLAAPLQSHIALAPAGGDGRENIDNNDALTLERSFDLDLRNCRLVTLSACESGLTDFTSESDEYVGLPSAFLCAGSPCVVSSLWKVDDLSTALLFIRFYQQLRDASPVGSPFSVSTALNDAQGWLRRITKTKLTEWAEKLVDETSMHWIKSALAAHGFEDRPFRSSYYWAGFCTIGT